MDGPHTTAAIQGYLDELVRLKDRPPDDAVVRALLARATGRLHLLCTAMLLRSYPRLTRPPLNLRSEEMLSAVVERLLKAMKDVKPGTARQFFALVNRHMRWELNDLARRLDERSRAEALPDDVAALPESDGSVLSPSARRMLDAIENLPEEEREVFELVRIQGMTQSEVAELLGVAVKTVQRRLNRSLLSLSETLGDLRPADEAHEI